MLSYLKVDNFDLVLVYQVASHSVRQIQIQIQIQVAAAHSLRDFHPSEYLGMLGLFGALITSIQVWLS